MQVASPWTRLERTVRGKGFMVLPGSRAPGYHRPRLRRPAAVQWQQGHCSRSEYIVIIPFCKFKVECKLLNIACCCTLGGVEFMCWWINSFYWAGQRRDLQPWGVEGEHEGEDIPHAIRLRSHCSSRKLISLPAMTYMTLHFMQLNPPILPRSCRQTWCYDILDHEAMKDLNC